MKEFIMALDQGTTSSRAMLFERSGAIAASAQMEFPQIYPQPGWVEHDPQAIWESQLETARRALAKAGIQASQVAGIGVTNQRETTFIWDRKTGRPVHNAIVWQCRRTAALCEQLKDEGFDAVLRERTGLVTDAYFSGTKVAWLLENVAGVRKRAERGELAFGTADTFLLWRLSGGRLHITDPSNASRTLLFNIHTRAWDEEILEHLHIPPSLLPEVRPSSEIYGETSEDLFGSSIPLAGAAGDQQAATFGQACFRPGMAKNTYGTGCFLLLNTGEEAIPSTAGLLTTIGWTLGNRTTYCLEGSIFIAGAAVQWLRDGLGLIQESGEVEALASSVPDSGGVHVVPAFVGLGAPYWDPYARGLIIGLTRGSNAGHIARATLEAIAFQTRDVLEAMRQDAGIEVQTLRVDGGAARNDLLMQLQADLLGISVQRPRVSETTALGAAYLAGLAVGHWPSLQEIGRQWQVEREFHPTYSEELRQSRYDGWRKAVSRSREWAEA
ncbi:MAG TPA: glycerol kinase GlpK [Anaerolineales bacterium]|nr:glycerol kinase GlpK [Anaerolineales bacterium]